MPKINKSKVAQVSVDEKVVADADAMQPAPPEPTSPSKPSPRLPAAASPGRKELKDRASAVKEAKREYLVLARRAAKLEKQHARRKTLLEQHPPPPLRAANATTREQREQRHFSTSPWSPNIILAAIDIYASSCARQCAAGRQARL